MERQDLYPPHKHSQVLTAANHRNDADRGQRSRGCGAVRRLHSSSQRAPSPFSPLHFAIAIHTDLTNQTAFALAECDGVCWSVEECSQDIQPKWPWPPSLQKSHGAMPCVHSCIRASAGAAGGRAFVGNSLPPSLTGSWQARSAQSELHSWFPDGARQPQIRRAPKGGKPKLPVLPITRRHVDRSRTIIMNGKA